jgi:hypothetical protein
MSLRDLYISRMMATMRGLTGGCRLLEATAFF